MRLALNLEMRALGPELLRLRSTGVYHTDPLPDKTLPVPPDLWVRPVATEATIGLFEDGAHRRYMMVVNRDLRQPQTITLNFQTPVRKLAAFDRTRKTWIAVKIAKDIQGNPMVRLTVQPGDGVLVKVR